MDDKITVQLPYVKGVVLTIYPYTPPTEAEAQAYDYDEEERRAALKDREPPVTWVPDTTLLNARSSTTTGPGSVQLHITKEIAVGEGITQVVLCTISGGLGQPQAQYIAKIYDPRLLGDPGSGILDHFPVIQTRWAALDCSCETTAYQRIEANKATRPYPCTPEYFGTWAFQLTSSLSQPSGSIEEDHPAHRRTIGVLLMEYVDGCTLQDTCQSDGVCLVDEKYCLSVLEQYCESEAWLRHIYVWHTDMALRNVMVAPSPLGNAAAAASQHLRTVIIDFNEVHLEKRHPKDPPYTGADAHLPKSPILHFWHSFIGFDNWAPDWFIHNLPQRRRWLMETFGDSPRYRRIHETLDPDELNKWDKMWMKGRGFESNKKAAV